MPIVMGCGTSGVWILELDKPDVVGQLNDPVHRLHAVRQSASWPIKLSAAGSAGQRDLQFALAQC